MRTLLATVACFHPTEMQIFNKLLKVKKKKGIWVKHLVWFKANYASHVKLNLIICCCRHYITVGYYKQEVEAEVKHWPQIRNGGRFEWMCCYVASCSYINISASNRDVASSHVYLYNRNIQEDADSRDSWSVMWHKSLLHLSWFKINISISCLMH